MFNPHIKFEMSTITCNEETNKNAKWKILVLSHPLGDFGVTYALSEIIKVIELLSPNLMAETLWANICLNCAVWKGVGHFEHKLQAEGGLSQATFGVRKLESLGYRVVLFGWFCF